MIKVNNAPRCRFNKNILWQNIKKDYARNHYFNRVVKKKLGSIMTIKSRSLQMTAPRKYKELSVEEKSKKENMEKSIQKYSRGRQTDKKNIQKNITVTEKE